MSEINAIGRELWDRLKTTFLRSELAAKDARIAELEAANSEITIEALRDRLDLHARVEQAELELDEMNAIHQRAQLAELAARDANARAERAEAELKVAREALQGLCDEIELSEDYGEGAHDERCPICVAYREARAALAGPTPQPQDQSAQVEAASAEPRPPVSEFEAFDRPRPGEALSHRPSPVLKGRS